ncbi:MarR family transcriptional regulator [Agromyces protaetiae]|uniref:MarR family transcriptional regulator n=1 Tax=Agromyces protaetiae TaxID=2509455 RepID=A0A4P6F871_9MICO|nr:MarR family transcriptional regulator [Agromyces protaetiae]QAY72290.1 MarR family transcriptional regulator [Agromyces protaetiae]
MPRDEHALRAAVEQSAAVLTAAGFPKMPARVLMSLAVAERGGKTAAELADELTVSPAAISGAVRYLQTVGIIHRIPQPGSRRDKWELLDDAWYSTLVAKSPVYAAISALSDKLADAIGDDDSPPGARTREMARFYRFIDRKMPELLRDWEDERGSVG